MKIRLLQTALLCAAILSQPAQAADTETSAMANQLLAGFEKWLTPQLSDNISLEDLAPEGASLIMAPGSATPASGIIAEPSAALRDEQARLNYHGVHFAVAVLEADGKHLAMRPFSKGFKSGERFKLRVVSTFSGAMQVENINPKWERKQIYPAAASQRIRLQAGEEILIPDGKDEFFKFAKTKGEEQLVVTVQDERATEKSASHSHVYRQDKDYGSNFIQESAFDTYPAISGTVKLKHN